MLTAAEKLILFTRFPQPGRVKTRLINALGATGAADLHRRLTEHALRQARDLACSCPAALEVRYTGGTRSQMATWLGSDLQFRSQVAGDLGTRLDRAFTHAFSKGARAVVIMGSDCPGLTSRILREAFTELESCELVLGPAADGGYYLVGLRQCTPEIFRDIPWGSDQVLARSLSRAARLGLATNQLGLLSDVDRPADLALVKDILVSEPVDTS